MSSSLETLRASEVPLTAPDSDNRVALVVAAHPDDVDLRRVGVDG